MLFADVSEKTLLLQVANGHSRHRAVDLQPLTHNGWSDELRLGDFLHEFVISALVEHNQVSQLLLDFALAPLLLFRATAGHGSLHLGLLRLLHHFVCTQGCCSNLEAHSRVPSTT